MDAIQNIFNEDYLNFKAGKPHELEEDSVEAYHDMMEILSEELPELLPYARNCPTIFAWDLERAGYLARIFVHVGWISEDEGFEWLEKVATNIKQEFVSWEQYVVSIMIGRALHFASADPILGATYEIFVEDNTFINSHPISNL